MSAASNIEWILEENVNDGAVGVEARSGGRCITHAADPIGGDMAGGENAGSALALGANKIRRPIHTRGNSIARLGSAEVRCLCLMEGWSRQASWFMQACCVFIWDTRTTPENETVLHFVAA
jgi:hypothetical protein